MTTNENQTEKRQVGSLKKNPPAQSHVFSPHTPNPVDIWMIIKYKVSQPTPVVDMLKTQDAITKPKNRE